MDDRPRRFLFISLDALIADFAWQVSRDGNDIRFYIESESEWQIANVFLTKVDSWEDHVDWSDVIVFDDVLGQGKKARYINHPFRGIHELRLSDQLHSRAPGTIRYQTEWRGTEHQAAAVRRLGGRWSRRHPCAPVLQWNDGIIA